MKSEAQHSCVTTARRVYGKKRVIPAKPTSSTLSACHQQVVAQHFTPKAGPACLDPRQVIPDKGGLPGELTPLSLFMLQSFPCSTVRDTSNRLLHTAFYKAHLLKFASYNHDWWLFFFFWYILCLHLLRTFSPREKPECHSYEPQFSGGCSCLACTEQIQLQAVKFSNIFQETTTFQLVLRSWAHGGMSVMFAEAHGPVSHPEQMWGFGWGSRQAVMSIKCLYLTSITRKTPAQTISKNLLKGNKCIFNATYELMMSNKLNFLHFFWSSTWISTEGRCCQMTLFLTAFTGHFCKRCMHKITVRRAERRSENLILTPDTPLRGNISSAALQCLCCSRTTKRWKSILATREDWSPEDDANRVRILTNIGTLEEWQKKQVQVYV